MLNAKSSGSNLSWWHGGDLIIRQLETFGIEYLFTLTGGHISPLYDGARFASVALIDFRHEQAAVHAADAFARLRRDGQCSGSYSGAGYYKWPYWRCQCALR